MTDAAQTQATSAPATTELHVDKPQINGGAAFTLQLLHLADGEAGLLAAQTAPNLAALVDAFDDDYTNTLILAGGDNFLPSPFLNAGTDPSLNAVIGRTGFARPDIAIHNAIGVEASAIGNHEFDLGSNVFADAIRPDGAWSGALFPHVSANLLFSGDSALNPRFTNTLDGGATTLLPEANTLNGRIVPAAVITEGGERIGILGATTQLIESISSPSGTEVAGFPTGPGPNGEVDNMALLAAQLQPVIDEMIAEGINKIVLMSHLQQIANEQQLATLLRGVDIILAAGSNTRLGDADDTAVAFPGHSASFQGTYPIQTTGADGRPVVIVNTDNEYTYLGRLVVDFDANGEIITNSLTANTAINGAYASTAENVAAAWGTTVENLATTAFADGTRGDRVRDITTAVQSVISSKDGNVFGFTNVYLEGERGFVRSQETNLGNLTADANGHAGREALGEAGASAFVVSLKNGGGIRAQIGSISSAGGASDKLPPIANPDAGKPAGGVSELDIENSLRFDNKLMMFDTTAAGLKAILEHGVAAWPNQGRFPQLGGVRFSWDPDSPPGSRISSIALINDDDQVVARLYDDGAFLPGAPETISVVVLNFLAQGGDGYPIKANGENFRYLLTDGTLSAAIGESLDFTAAANVPANVLGEQQALEQFLQTFHATQETAYNEADTSAALDMRIQNLNFRNDAVFQGDRIDGDAASESLEGTAGDDTINGGGGSDSLTGGDGVDTANFAGSATGMNIDLEGGFAQTVLTEGQLTPERAMLSGQNGFSVTPLFTVGETVEGTSGALNSATAGDYTPTGILDGIGAYSLDENTVRVFVNSELAANRGAFYELENGVSLQGARIHFFDIDKTTKAVVDSGVAYGEIYDRAGNLVTAASQLTGNALRRFCSGALMEEEQFGAGNGLADRIYFAGEENSNGSMWALDTDTGTLWEVPEMGRGGWENVTQINTGNTTDVAFLLADDTTGAPLYLYIGRKDATGDFLDRNGLRDGQLYVWKADNASANSPAELVSGSLTGAWVAIEARDPAMAGQAGYDALGYKNDTTLRAEADALGAFTFSRPEDVSTNPANGAQVVFASTGASIAAGATADGVADATDVWGTVYTLDFNFLQPLLIGPLQPAATTVNVLYNGNTDATRALRSPDNLDWADDGMIYVQEDRSTNWAAAQAANGNEASIVRINPNTGAIERVAVMDRSAVPAGQTDGNPADFGNWESSGILDVSELFGLAGGSLFIGDVQAHSIGLGSSALVEGGQLFLLAREGVDATPVETTQLDGFENVIGTGFADMIGGNASGNVLEGRNGDDWISGLAGEDTIYGGTGNDQMSGGAGNDLFFIDSIFDRAIEVAGEGSADRIYTTVGYQLLAGSDVEEIASIAATGIGLAGNELNNQLFGAAGDDTMFGHNGDDTIFGGTGNDQMFGGAGNDLFFIDSIFDRAYDIAGEGSADRIYTSVGYQLLAGWEVEEIVSIASTGIGLAGNELNNKLFAAAGDDTMFGLDGDDMLEGYAGNDLMDGGAGADTLNGSLGDDMLFGQGGNDVLDGGNGIDGLWGGADADIFQLTNAEADRDVFGDFTSGEDKFDVRTAFFGAGLDGDANGVLDANRFTANATGQATTADQRFVYNTVNNYLYYDADGSGAGARQLIGVAANGATLAATDFIVTGAPAV